MLECWKASLLQYSNTPTLHSFTMKKIIVVVMMISMGVPFPLTELKAEVKELKTFEAGDVIHASEVNENFLILKEAIERLDTLLQEKTTAIEARDRTLTLLEQENKILKEEVTKLKTNLQSLPNKETMGQLEKLLQEKIAEIEAKTHSLELFEQENQALKQEMAQLKASLKTLLEQSVEQLEAIFEAKTAEIEVKDRSREQLEAENQLLKKEMAKLKASIKALKEQSQLLAEPKAQVSGEQPEAVSPEIPVGDTKEWTDPLTGMEFVWVPEGCFQMGSPEDEKGRSSDEGPVHEVCLDGFWMGKYEVTQTQWQQMMGNNPSNFTGENLPVENVSWNDVQEFLQTLNKQAGKEMYRLPTEAEWEYAARAGTETTYSFGGDTDKLDDYAWYSSNSGSQTHPVGELKPNAWELYDVHGNVWEWCQDWYDKEYYSKSPQENPQGLSSGTYRVLRGGSWGNAPNNCRSANRGRNPPDYWSNFFGFRVVVGSAAWTQ